MWRRGSVDGGEQWMAAMLDPSTAHAAWRFWSYPWAVPTSGRYSLVVLATDGSGKTQPSIEQDPVPEGATGLHEIVVTVE